ncbi:MAG: hypothetical protein AABZ14_02215, partial [Candidatus Margulisiibacteriota bacterium]
GTLDDVLKTYSSVNGAKLVGLLSGNALMTVGAELAVDGFRFADGKSGFSVLDSLNTVDMERAISTWGATGSTVLRDVIDTATQTDINNWLSKLSYSWVSSPNLSNLGSKLESITGGKLEELITGSLAKLLIQASGSKGVEIIKSAFVQEALSAGIGALDFEDPDAAMINLMAGLLVNDGSVFLQALDIAVQSGFIDTDAISEINKVLTVKWGDNTLTLSSEGWITASGKSVFKDDGDYSFDSTCGLTAGASISMTIISGTTTITVTTQMSLDQKLQMLAEAFGSDDQAGVISDLLIAISTHASASDANQSEAATLILNAMINGYTDATGKVVISPFAGTDVSAVLYELAQDADGLTFLDIYVLSDDSLHGAMFEGFVAYCATQTNGTATLANLLNVNYDSIAEGTFSNATLNKLLTDMAALSPADYATVINGLAPETIVAILNNDDVSPAAKTKLTTQIIASWPPEKIASIFIVGDATKGIDIGLCESPAESLIVALNTAGKLDDVLATMTKEQVLALINTGDGIDDPALG